MNANDIRLYEAASRALQDWDIAPLANALRNAGIDFRTVRETVTVQGERHDFSSSRRGVVFRTRTAYQGLNFDIAAFPRAGWYVIAHIFDGEDWATKAPGNILHTIADVVGLAEAWQLGRCSCGSCERPTPAGSR